MVSDYIFSVLCGSYITVNCGQFFCLNTGCTWLIFLLIIFISVCNLLSGPVLTFLTKLSYFKIPKFAFAWLFLIIKALQYKYLKTLLMILLFLRQK